MKKAIDQTVRDLKRGVNKKVLKVPSIEQKILDVTSNENWAPHGSTLAEIAQATRNYHEYQIIMSVIWKRIHDTGKNWRHVYKALIVLEYLVAHGSEHVIDDIREHSYQISTLSDFQYIDSNGNDQGNIVRKKAQGLVVLVNDKGRIQEVRKKAAANRDKYQSTPGGSTYRSGSSRYDDRYSNYRNEGRYENQVDDRNGFGEGKEWGSRGDNRYGHYGDLYSRERDRYGRDYEERNRRDGYRDDFCRGRSQSIDYSYNSRSISVDQDRNSANDDDGQYSSSNMDMRADPKYSYTTSGALPSYEDSVGATHSPSYNDREFSQPNASQEYVASNASPNLAHASPHAPTPTSMLAPTSAPTPTSEVRCSYQEVGEFDEFDPRGPSSATPTMAPAAAGVEMDLLGSLADSFSSNSLSIVSDSQPTVNSEANGSTSINSEAAFEAAPTAYPDSNQSFDDPFGDGPFRALPSEDNAPTDSFNTDLDSSQKVDAPQPSPPPNAVTESNSSFNEASASYTPFGPPAVQHPTSTQFLMQELSTPQQEVDILADILPPNEPSSSINTQGGYPASSSQSMAPHTGFPHQTDQHAPLSYYSSYAGHNPLQNNFRAQTGQSSPHFPQHGQPSPQTRYLPSAEYLSQTGYPSQNMPSNSPFQPGQVSQMGFHSQVGRLQPNTPNPSFYGAYNSQSLFARPAAGYMVPLSSTGQVTQYNFLSQTSRAGAASSQMSAQAPQIQSNLMPPPSTTPPSTVPAAAPQPATDKFETKSTVWADTLSRGLVNLDISGAKANPLADIGVDFDAINRKEKRMEKQTPCTVTSTVIMGKAMGSGSGMGRAGASALRAPSNPMMGPGMHMGMAGGGPGGAGFDMGGYGANQPNSRGISMGMPHNFGMGMNMPSNIGMGMNMPTNMGMGMNMHNNMGMEMGIGMNTMNMGRGMNTQQPLRYPPGSTTPGGYNHMAGPGYGQYPHGGGYH